MDRGTMFSFAKETNGMTTELFFNGIINEFADLQSAFADLENTAKLVINLEGVRAINSCGVRDWVSALNGIEEGIDIEFVACSRQIVHQLNMITNFLSKGRLISFQAPYYCETCDKEHVICLDMAEHFADPEDRREPEAPEENCPTCGKDMELNEDEEKYFHFLTGM